MQKKHYFGKFSIVFRVIVIAEASLSSRSLISVISTGSAITYFSWRATFSMQI
jgi:hypothetical protein